MVETVCTMLKEAYDSLNQSREWAHKAMVADDYTLYNLASIYGNLDGQTIGMYYFVKKECPEIEMKYPEG